jgi:hypothetical protein
MQSHGTSHFVLLDHVHALPTPNKKVNTPLFLAQDANGFLPRLTLENGQIE